ncbi:MAG TPA: Crp/Fnr family transcriptional regulator [Spirochaetia bacterium]|nr:Crp/Fnr family transcriptional regulator [Spirochaetia bacterium]
MSDYREYLRHIPIFAGLDQEELAEIAKLVIERRYGKRRIIFMEGEPGEAVFFLKSGRIKIAKTTPDGREHILHYIQPGEVFAEVVLFGDQTYPASAEVMEDSLIGLVRNRDMEALLIKSPSIGVALLKLMARRLREAQAKINSLAHQDSYRRMTGMLLDLARTYGVQAEKGTCIDINLTNQELANLIGTTRETANRILNDFRRSGVLEVDRQKITITDEKKLKSWLSTT